MLEITGPGYRYCDGVSRRSFLRIGGLTLGSAAALTLADLNRAEAATGKRQQHKAVIHVFLGGGPPHQDMWDLKMEAPAEIRGEFKPIPTNVSGLEICEVFPKMAKVMDRCAVLRSIVGSSGGHDGFECLSGWPRRALANQGGQPSIGSVVARLNGPIDRAIPPSIGLAAPTAHSPWSEPGGPGYLGPSYAPFCPNAMGGAGGSRGEDVLRLKNLTLDRLQDRKRLLQVMDAQRRDLDRELSVQSRDAATEAAFDLLTSSKLADALDVSKESAKTRERYGDGKPYKFQYDGAPTCNDHLLIARRLIEVGARSVSLSYGRWDSHGDNFGLVRDHGAKLDQCLSALILDLEERGMLNDVTVIAWGEFGRTPVINKDAGRDHWPQVCGALIAGGGIRGGQVVGATNRLGEYATERPIQFREVAATLYHNLGVSTESVTIEDRSGRPQYIMDRTPPMPELVG